MKMKKLIITGGSGFIGSYIIEELGGFEQIEILNLDLVPPTQDNQYSLWCKSDINNLEALRTKILSYDPDYIIHLAAKTDTLSDDLEQYFTNIKGVENLIKVANQCSNLKKIVITSTQYVYKDKNKPYPENDRDYKPHTIYGVSKVLTEKITQDKCKKPFTIVRPTNVWGARNKNYEKGLFRIIDKGLLLLPNDKLSIKSYGFVRNICQQIIKIAFDEKIINNVLYVGEKEISSKIWLEDLHVELKGRKPRYIPKLILLNAARLGDIMIKIGLPFPIYSTRYMNMLEDYLVPIDETIEKYGIQYPNLKSNIKETINSYRNDN